MQKITRFFLDPKNDFRIVCYVYAKKEHLQLLGRPNFSAPKFKNASDMYICQIKALKVPKVAIGN